MADRSLNPTCEDYHSEDGDEVVTESFRRSPVASANVAAKRSHPSDLGTEKPANVEKVGNIDLQSDSGYSSHTAATMSSADSAPSAKSQSPPTPAVSAAPIPQPSPARRRPTIENERKSSSSPRKPLQRSGSVSSRRPSQRREEECNDPNCTTCPPARGRRLEPSPLDSGLDISYPTFDQQPQRSHRAPYPPQSPTYTRQPPSYIQGSAVVQPAQSTRRRSSSTSRGSRPLSYHGEPRQGHWVPGMPHPTPPYEHGPPPSMSAHFGVPMQPQMAPYGMMGATPPNNPYVHPMQISPPYERPMQSRTPSQYSTRRPTSQYGLTLVTYDQNGGNMPSARYPSAPQSARDERFPRSAYDPESSEAESSEEENGRALMPAPPPKAISHRRPSLRRPNTTQAYDLDRLSQSKTLPERPRERDSRVSRISSAAPSRAPSTTRRPTLIQQPKAQSYETAGNARVMVESSARARRRQSYMGHEKQYELEEKARNSKLYQNIRGEPIIHPGNRRRQTDLDPRRRDDNLVETKTRQLRDAEAYQQRTRGNEIPLTDQALKSSRRMSRGPSGASETGSSRSKNSDKASRISQSNRTTVTNGGNGEIRLRVDASAPLSLQFNGDMEGRTISLNPAEGGMADIVIGASRGSENVYRSEKGSVTGPRKALMANQARREAEESSVRSRRSDRSGRDGERRVLRRQRDREIGYDV
ncbi:hypothetical protein K469DRAFT_580714 [Zopfia rhizophila CBS 207.26]|uniref:Uncharacterized protein n=1 Tax=Zopfia rhizophila CBS 207.26 TaxID=1314779 RepID=A0A6A6DWG8_9PEZI|nr:hypothetical protein K469DRAFT_580714 [Zopfia rhizophila CBS 207.26]